MRGILTWHSIDESGSAISVTRPQFEKQLAAIRDRGISVVSLADLISRDDDEDAVALTFDDGFENFAGMAAPLLQAHGFSATIFVVTAHVGTNNDWPSRAGAVPVPVLPLMSWETLRSMSGDGFEIGSHGVTHRALDSLQRDEVITELRASHDTIAEMICSKPKSFVFPYGAVSEFAMSEAAGIYRLACTTECAILDRGASVLALPRLDAYYFRDASMLEWWGSARFRSYVTARSAGRALRNALSFGR